MATPLATERKRPAYTKQQNGNGMWIITASRIFDVSGATSEDNAIEILEAQMNVSEGSEHPQAVSAKCNFIQVEQLSVGGLYKIDAQYTSDSSENLDLRIEPPVISYEPYLYQLPSYVDANGKEYTNTAGTPFDHPMELDVVGVILNISKWEDYYPIAKMIQYGGKTNTGTFSWPGGSVNEGQAKCLGVFQGETSSSTGLVKVTYRFDLRDEGHKKNTPDIGKKAWGTVNSSSWSGLIVGGDSNAPIEARLDGTGKPLNSAFKMKPSQDSPTYTIIVPPYTPDSQSLVNTSLSTGSLKILSFARSKSIVFNLGL